MISRNEREQILRYFIGGLSHQERKRINKRFLRDPAYSELLMRAEEWLTPRFGRLPESAFVKYFLAPLSGQFVRSSETGTLPESQVESDGAESFQTPRYRTRDWDYYHTQSEGFAASAEVALREGDETRAIQLYMRAAAAEWQAFKNLDQTKTRTLGVTVVSAAALHYKAGEYLMARSIAEEWITKDGLPAFARKELRAILDAVEQPARDELNDFIDDFTYAMHREGVLSLDRA